MQNSNPNPSRNPDPSLFVDPVLAAAYQRAREATGGAEPSARDLFAALGAIPDEPCHPDPDAGTEPDRAAPRFDLDQLLRTFRTQIDWALSVAQLRAEDSMDAASVADLGAIDRVRVAIQRRHTPGSPAPASLAQEAPLRASDLLVVIERLFGAIDPALLTRAARALTSGVAEVFRIYPAMLSLFARLVPPADPQAPGETCFGAASPVRPPPASVYVPLFGAAPFGSPTPVSAPQPFGRFAPCAHPPYAYPPVDPHAHVLRTLFFR